MKKNTARRLVVIALVIAVVALGGRMLMSHVGPDTSCSAKARDAQPQVQAFVTGIAGNSDASWHDGCKDGAVAALRFTHTGSPDAFGTAATAAGCTAVAGKQDAYACTTGATRFTMGLNSASSATSQSGLAVITGL